MALEIYWSKKASSKFDKILEYLENKFGNQTTVKFVKKVFEFLDLLENFPNLGTLENEELGFRAFVIVKQITLFYQVKEDKIILLNFYDNRQNPKNKRF